jgi:glutamate-ammonia-ligase adenylyltransferase
VVDRLDSAARSTLDPAAAVRALERLRDTSDEARAEIEAAPQAVLSDLANLLVISPPSLEALRNHPAWIGRLARRAPGPSAPPALAGGDLDQVRASKLRESIDVALRDVAGLAPFDETVSRLSGLADAAIEHCLEHSWSELVGECPPGFGSAPEGIAVFALGKLGGRELNYSSDIDLVFIRRPEPESPGPAEQELRFFTKLGERVIRLLSHAGRDGFLYRVDMRLRPYGESGPLVPTLPSVIDYYDSWAEAWERQALLKLRFVAGAADVGRRFTEFASQFLFSRPMDDAALEELKRVKHRAEREYAQPTGRVHVKQGPGGIRDIEFYVQFLQLAAGSSLPAVRSASTLEAIERLSRARMLLDGEESALSIAYLLLRTVEHRLQLRSLTPNAILPENRSELESLARGLGFGGEDAAAQFEAVLGLHRARVRAMLERVYLTPGYLHVTDREGELAQLLTERTPRDRARDLLAQHRFEDPDRAWKNVRLLAVGPAGRMLPPGERRTFLGLAFRLLEVLGSSLDPDQALDHIESFASATGNRVSFLRSMAAQPAQLLRFADLVAFSNYAHQILVRHPEYLDTLVLDGATAAPRSRAELEAELLERLRQAPRSSGKPAIPDLLRRFRQRETIRVAYRDLAGESGPLEVSAELTDLAEACVQAALASATPGEDEGLVVLGLGKLGSRQMHYSSDLDLVFLYRDPRDEPGPEQRAERARRLDAGAERILELLADVTAEGTAYTVDLRLRPEGASGLLARSWTSFIEYAELYMKPWERMALVRARVIAPTAAAESWRELRDRVVYGFTWDAEAIESVRHLKRRIEAETRRESRTHLDFKHGHGGIADLEFLIQMLQVLHGAGDEAVRSPVIDVALPALERAGALSAAEASDLAAAHRFARKVETHYQLMDEGVAREISRESPQLTRLARSLGFTTGDAAGARRAFVAEWERHAARVRQLVERYFYGADAAQLNPMEER